MQGPRLVPWLLTLGLAIATFAWSWQRLEEGARAPEGTLRVPDAVSWQPHATLVARIQETWVPGDRLRTGLLLVGVALCGVGAWRAWRVEGLPVGVVRRIALSLAIVGASCLLVGFLGWRTHPPELTCAPYVSADYYSAATPGEPRDIGYEQVLGSDPPAGMLPLLLHGAILLVLGLLLGLLSLLYPPRAPLRSRGPASTP